MTTPPTFSFSGIDFNQEYFSSSLNASLNYLSSNYINKITGETSTGIKTFSTNQTYFTESFNINNGSFNLSSINFYNPSLSLKANIKHQGTSLLFDSLVLSNGIRIQKNGSNVSILNNTVLQFLSSITMVYSTLPTLTTSQVGFNYGTTTQSYTGNKSTPATYLAYSSANSVPLPVGKYLITINAAIGGVAQASGTVNPFIVGYTLGTSSTPSSNTAYPIFTSSVIIFSGFNANYEYNISSVVSITTDQSYLSAYSSNTLTTVFTGSCQSGICSYYVVRIA